MKLILIDWEDNDLIGGFYADTLEQCFNTDSKLLAWSLQHTMKMNNVTSVEISFIKSHEDLNILRKNREITPKPTLDEYLMNLNLNDPAYPR